MSYSILDVQTCNASYGTYLSERYRNGVSPASCKIDGLITSKLKGCYSPEPKMSHEDMPVWKLEYMYKLLDVHFSFSKIKLPSAISQFITSQQTIS